MTAITIAPALNIRIARFLFASTVSRKCHDVVTVKPCAQWTTLTAILTSDSLVVLLKTANEANAVYLGNVAIVPECIRYTVTLAVPLLVCLTASSGVLAE